MGNGSNVATLLESIFKNWSFTCMDASGRSGDWLWGGIIIGSNLQINGVSTWAKESTFSPLSLGSRLQF
jgi:hypothetical protein